MQFPAIRLRRNRKTQWARDLVAETNLSPQDFIYPLFIHEGNALKTPVTSMPGVCRLSVDLAVDEAIRARDLGIPVIALFPTTPMRLKNEQGTEALNSNNLICQAITAIKSKVKDIGVMADVALDPYTSHGHDGVLLDNEVDNDKTTEILRKQALMLAQCGCDIIAPSDMMDGRIAAIRDTLEKAGFHHTQIAAYSAKYASNYYGPYRDAVGSIQLGQTIDKRSYQMDFRNADEAISEIALDIQEGADMVIIKPGMPYLDIISKARAQFNTPLLAYQVSGEFSMLKLAANQGLINLLETMIAFKRAGCSGIITYAACDAAQLIRK
jgi:porphobilinogen synthase